LFSLALIEDPVLVAFADGSGPDLVLVRINEDLKSHLAQESQ